MDNKISYSYSKKKKGTKLYFFHVLYFKYHALIAVFIVGIVYAIIKLLEWVLGNNKEAKTDFLATIGFPILCLILMILIYIGLVLKRKKLFEKNDFIQYELEKK